MGLSSSKHNAPGPSPSSSSSSSGAVVQRSRSKRSRVLKPSCLRSHSTESDEAQASDSPSEENGKTVSCSSENKSGSCPVSDQCYTTDKAEQSNGMGSINSGIQLHEWGESSFANTGSEGHSSRGFSSSSLNPPGRFLSRFNFYPGNLSFRLTRANSLGSARSYPSEGECQGPSGGLVNRNDRPQRCDFFPACFTSRSPRTQDDNCASNSSSDISDNFQDNRRLNSGYDGLRDRNDTRVDCSPNLFSPINHVNSDGGGTRHAERRISAREPAERNIRFSRTLSVGRLRDRVHRRTPAADLDLYNFQQDREARLAGHITGRQVFDHAEAEATSDDNNFSPHVSSNDVPSSFSNASYGSQNHAYGTPRARETRYRDLLEHRSNFLERRRRIRSQLGLNIWYGATYSGQLLQVRALQRLGSPFENQSGHERSCIISGGHQRGRCTCHIVAPEANSNDDANARASI